MIPSTSLRNRILSERYAQRQLPGACEPPSLLAYTLLCHRPNRFWDECSYVKHGRPKSSPLSGSQSQRISLNVPSLRQSTNCHAIDEVLQRIPRTSYCHEAVISSQLEWISGPGLVGLDSRITGQFKRSSYPRRKAVHFDVLACHH